MGKKNSKKQEAAAQNEQQVVNVEAQIVTEPTQELQPAEEATEPTAIDLAAAELAEAKAKMAEAKKKLAEAKKATIKSRPVRLSTFIVRTNGGETFITKSDVHYCAEKAAIDILTESIKNNEENDYIYIIWKQNKADESNAIIVEKLWIDKETKQIVIE